MDSSSYPSIARIRATVKRYVADCLTSEYIDKRFPLLVLESHAGFQIGSVLKQLDKKRLSVKEGISRGASSWILTVFTQKGILRDGRETGRCNREERMAENELWKSTQTHA